MLLIQVPIVIFILSFFVNDNLYVIYEDTKAILFAISCISIWLGLMNSAQEICKEKVILQKEYMSGLKLSAYLVSKFIVQGVIAFIQAILLVAIFHVLIGESSNSILINSFWDMQIICFLTILAASSMGLCISSLVKESNVASSIIPIVLVPQLMMIFDLDDFTKFTSNFILCKWALDGLGTSVNLNGLTHEIQLYAPLTEIEEEACYTFTSGHILQVILMIILMIAILLILTYMGLRKNVNKNM